MSEAADKAWNKAIKYANDTPGLLSYLYDVDLMPEQVERGTHEAWRMYRVIEAWMNATRLEREACAQISEQLEPAVWPFGVDTGHMWRLQHGQNIASAIRLRGVSARAEAPEGASPDASSGGARERG